MRELGRRGSEERDEERGDTLARPPARIARSGVLLACLIGLGVAAAACSGGEGEDLSGAAGSMMPDSSIGGIAWEDGDGDGQQGGREAVLGGIDVSLLQDGDGDGTCETRIGSVATGEDGSFLFEGVGPGTYCLAYGDVIGEAFDYEGGEGAEQGLGVRP